MEKQRRKVVVMDHRFEVVKMDNNEPEVIGKFVVLSDAYYVIDQIQVMEGGQNLAVRAAGNFRDQ